MQMQVKTMCKDSRTSEPPLPPLTLYGRDQEPDIETEISHVNVWHLALFHLYLSLGT